MNAEPIWRRVALTLLVVPTAATPGRLAFARFGLRALLRLAGRGVAFGCRLARLRPARPFGTARPFFASARLAAMAAIMRLVAAICAAVRFLVFIGSVCVALRAASRCGKFWSDAMPCGHAVGSNRHVLRFACPWRLASLRGWRCYRRHSRFARRRLLPAPPTRASLALRSAAVALDASGSAAR